jgi:NTE family protein
VSNVGLVLGGGGVTGASFELAALFGIRMATGWDPDDAAVIVGTSCGALVGSVIRCGELTLESVVGELQGREELTEGLRRMIYRRAASRGTARWLRHGVLPGLRSPGVKLAVGGPARYHTGGIARWLRRNLGPAADSWPEKPFVIVAYDVEAHRRVAFGTENAPQATVAEAASASAAVPLIFQPVPIEGRLYVDGGVASGTNADLVLGNPDPLDLVLVIAPMASVEARHGSRFYEDILDRAGRTALAKELDCIRDRWPEAEVLVIRPDEDVLEAMRPNPMAVDLAVPAFLKALRSMRDQLARREVWSVLERHLVGGVKA